jgi:hypothetical protein
MGTILFTLVLLASSGWLKTTNAKMWLPPELVDDSTRSDNILQVAASQDRFGYLYIAWQDWDTSGTYNIYGKSR